MPGHFRDNSVVLGRSQSSPPYDPVIMPRLKLLGAIQVIQFTDRISLSGLPDTELETVLTQT